VVCEPPLTSDVEIRDELLSVGSWRDAYLGGERAGDSIAYRFVY